MENKERELIEKEMDELREKLNHACKAVVRTNEVSPAIKFKFVKFNESNLNGLLLDDNIEVSNLYAIEIIDNQDQIVATLTWGENLFGFETNKEYPIKKLSDYESDYHIKLLINDLDNQEIE